MTDTTISVDDLTDEQVERVVNSTGFQKMLAYHNLADGIEVLKDEDQLFDSMVNSIRTRHSQVSSEASVREFFDLFIDEVETYTDDLTGDGADDVADEATDLDALLVDGEEEG